MVHPEGHKQGSIWIQDVYEKKIAKVYIMLFAKQTLRPRGVRVLVLKENLLDKVIFLTNTKMFFIQYCLKVGNIGKYRTDNANFNVSKHSFCLYSYQQSIFVRVTHHVIDIYRKKQLIKH